MCDVTARAPQAAPSGAVSSGANDETVRASEAHDCFRPEDTAGDGEGFPPWDAPDAGAGPAAAAAAASEGSMFDSPPPGVRDDATDAAPRRALDDEYARLVSELMARGLSESDAAAIAARHVVRPLPVIEEEGSVSGTVTPTDSPLHGTLRRRPGSEGILRFTPTSGVLARGGSAGSSSDLLRSPPQPSPTDHAGERGAEEPASLHAGRLEFAPADEAAQVEDAASGAGSDSPAKSVDDEGSSGEGWIVAE